jgi:pilus assembly protein CpaC
MPLGSTLPARCLAWCAVLVVALLGAVPASAQQAPRELFQGPAPSGVVRLEPGPHAGEFIVPLNKSQLLRIDRPFAEVTVGNPEIADVVPLTTQLVYVLGKQLGATNLMLMGQGGRVIAVVDLVVSFDVAGLKSKLFELLPGEAIEVRPAGDAIVLSGQVSSAGQLARALALAERFAPQRVTNLLTVGGTQQVMLQVRFAEVQRSTVKQLGLNTAVFAAGNRTAFAFESGDGFSPDAFARSALSILSGDVAIDLMLDALERKGLVRTLAEPNLIALSGDTASFLAGGEFPIPVASDRDDSGITITIVFKQFGVSLAFTPTVLGNDLVNLMLNTEVSAIDPTVSVVTSDITVPGLSVRRTNTTVELRDGQSFAIAGLLQDDFQDSIRQFPWLGDLPVLGALLRSTEYQRQQTELVVIVTPRLVAPSTPDALATPADRLRLPSESELFLLGRLEGRAPGLDPDRGGLDGPHGYIMQ